MTPKVQCEAGVVLKLNRISTSCARYQPKFEKRSGKYPEKANKKKIQGCSAEEGSLEGGPFCKANLQGEGKRESVIEMRVCQP